ncbi:spore gernimation protein GerC [Lottiidibacillus patelloidae]|uniref:Spore gernimation protein GerC n=1 Tax=Lottiidibacillus patelloidae TaxID=2670334 RepID=A0A263BWF9_9BACI|nr:Ger(x)C family spore germination protein [Lottiidibacillus patelloidae]OZM58081.1 spore gernimation protein GerC [Lottiidibacillus patelloidae]
MNRKYLILALLPFLLSGCWDKLELEEQAFVVVLGVDLAEDEEFIDVTFQMANPQVGSTTKATAENEKPSVILTLPATDIISARDTANALVTRKINLSHLKTIIISEELAKTDKFDKVVSSSIRDRQIRREINIIVTKEKAAEFINNNKPQLETRPHKYFEFMQKRWRDTGLVPYSTFNRYFQRSESTNTLFMAILATSKKQELKSKGYEDNYEAGQINARGGDPVQVIGSAILKEGKLIDTITGEETRIALLLRKESEADNWLATYEDPLNEGYRIAARLIKDKKTKININTDKKTPVVDVTVPITFQVVAIPSQENYVLDLKKQKLLKKSIAKALEEKTMEFVKKTKEEYKDEPFLWGYEVQKNFTTKKAYEKYNWKEKYLQAEVKVKYEITIEDFGKQLRPHEKEGGEN